jgi:hypothetical protein
MNPAFLFILYFIPGGRSNFWDLSAKKGPFCLSDLDFYNPSR